MVMAANTATMTMLMILNHHNDDNNDFDNNINSNNKYVNDDKMVIMDNLSWISINICCFLQSWRIWFETGSTKCDISLKL